MRELVSTTDLERARHDPQFRRQLLADSLDQLLVALNRTRNDVSNPETARQMREGADLAVRLAGRLQRYGNEPPQEA